MCFGKQSQSLRGETLSQRAKESSWQKLMKYLVLSVKWLFRALQAAGGVSYQHLEIVVQQNLHN